MNIIYPISFITNSFKDVLSLFTDEITVLFPFSDEFNRENETLKINILKDFTDIDTNLFSQKDISKIIQWASQFENFSNSILSDTLQTEIENETVNEILKNFKDSSSLGINKVSNNDAKLLLLTRFFYEYDKKQEEINSDYYLFQEKFKNLSKILNGNELNSNETEANRVININPMDFNIIKPNLRLKLWTNLFSKILFKGDINFIGISKEIRDIIMDLYYDITGKLPEICLELDLENINKQNSNTNEIKNIIKKILSLNNSKTDSKEDIIKELIKNLNSLWKSNYKPKENSVIKIYFLIFEDVSLIDLLYYHSQLKDKKEIKIYKKIEIYPFIG